MPRNLDRPSVQSRYEYLRLPGWGAGFDKKPSVPASIDESHPLARGLIAAWLFPPSDLTHDATGNYAGTLETQGLIAEYVDGPYGSEFCRDAAAVDNTIGINLGNIGSSDPLSGVPSGALSAFVFSFVDDVDGTQFGAFFAKANGGAGANGWVIAQNTQQNHVAHYVSGATEFTASYPPETADYFTYSIDFTSGGNGNLYVNGSFDSTEAISTFSSTTTGCFVGNYSYAQTFCAPGIIALAVWDRAISASEHILAYETMGPNGNWALFKV